MEKEFRSHKISNFLNIEIGGNQFECVCVCVLHPKVNVYNVRHVWVRSL